MDKKNFLVILLITVFCSFFAKYLSSFQSLKLIGHLVLALILGMLMQLFKFNDVKYQKATGYISNKFLRLGIILLGFKLNVYLLIQSGVKSIVLSIFVVVFTMSFIYFLSRKLGVEEDLALLSSSGCSICGAAAVMGINGVIKANKDDVILSVAIVAILGTLFTFVIVLIKPFIPLSEVQYGILSGASLHEIAHAIAAGSAGGTVALEMATIAKLTRVILLVPVAIFIISIKKSKDSKLTIPYFIFGFLITSIIGTYIKIPFIDTLVNLAYMFLAMAMAALGLNVNFEIIFKKGKKVLISSFIGSLLILIINLIIVKMIF